VVVGEGPEVQAKLKELEAFQAQGLSSVQQENISTTCQLGQSKLRLLGKVIEKDLGEVVPGVKGDSSQLVLEGSASEGDITKEQADALVNAANENLYHAGGVAAAPSRAGGPEVQRASRDLVRQLGRVPTGTVVKTTGGNLPCKMLLHAVGPVGGNVGGNERPLLEKTVKAALDLAETMELQTLAMPCISSGLFEVPLKVCSEAIVSATAQNALHLRGFVLGTRPEKGDLPHFTPTFKSNTLLVCD
uniref:Macro domain-containing protein n=1 Tax=Salmo trutta TaxID=8032 RepID=A0A674A4B3_SALTR